MHPVDTMDFNVKKESGDFLVFNIQATFLLGFLLNFCKWLDMAEIWPPYSFGSPGVKIMLWGVKNVKNFDYCLCSSCRAQFLSDLFYI